jgi:hypothetical protein
MPTSLSPRHVIAALIGAALIVAVGALEFATATANKRGVLLLFGTIAVGLALIGIATRLTRRVRVGSRLPMRMGSRAIFAWIFTRLILLVAVLVLLIGLLAALALDGPVAPLANAMVLMILLSVIVSLSGQIVIDGRLVFGPDDSARGSPASAD